jgi:hypothetical protein
MAETEKLKPIQPKAMPAIESTLGQTLLWDKLYFGTNFPSGKRYARMGTEAVLAKVRSSRIKPRGVLALPDCAENRA